MNRVLIYLVLSDAVTSESGEPERRYLLYLSDLSPRTPTLPHRPCQVGCACFFLLRSQLPIVVRGRLLERAACSSGGSLEASFLFSGVIVAE